MWNMKHEIISQLLQFSAWDRIVFENYVEVLETRLIPTSFMALNYSH